MEEENTTENDWADDLRQERNKGRVLRGASGATKATGRVMQAGGGAAQAAFKGTEMASRGVQTAAKGGKKASKGVMQVGRGFMGAGPVGAAIGAPLVVAGGVGYGASAVTEGAAKGTEEISKAGGKVAEKTREAGGKVKGLGEELNLAAQLRAGKMMDMAMKAAMPAPAKIAVRAAEMLGLDVMKWLKWAMIFALIFQYLLIIVLVVLFVGFLFVGVSTMFEALNYPVAAFSRLAKYLFCQIFGLCE